MSERTPPDFRQEEPNAVVTDPEDYAQRERLRQIYKARQEFQEARQKADRLRSEEAWELYEKQNYVLHAFQRYFFEVEGLMERHPKGGHYLEEVELGRSTPIEADEKELNQYSTRVFDGLRSLATDYRPMPTEGYRQPSSGARTRFKEVQTTVPEQIVLRAFRKVNQFLAEVGLDADMAGEQRDAGFDYADILEEGPPGGDAPNIDGSVQEGDSGVGD